MLEVELRRRQTTQPVARRNAAHPAAPEEGRMNDRLGASGVQRQCRTKRATGRAADQSRCILALIDMTIGRRLQQVLLVDRRQSPQILASVQSRQRLTTFGVLL